MVAQISVFEDLISLLSGAATPHDVLALRASDSEERRMDELVAKKHTGSLSERENLELHEFLLAEELIGLAKAHAYRKLRAA